MTTMTLRRFAKKLGYRRASNSEFKSKLRRWEGEGRVKVEQSGFKSDSKHHHKIVTIPKNFEWKQEKKKRFNWHIASGILDHLGYKVRTAEVMHDCSICNGIIMGCRDIFMANKYAMKQLFLTIKLCSHCIRRMLDEDSDVVVSIKLRRNRKKRM